ncbi:DUF3304 domain-containing protein [Collimonas silvisoli]|uniref:DUF3304 domain-containing protein n=1 Tax=Collimonas silvisoli TaxID=2825884 RepID=UPI001B8C1B15|nr:DUF3304 domain-containing protein [Collimonas silvisoli]
MRLLHSNIRFGWLRMLAISLIALVFAGCASVQAASGGERSTPVGLTGVQHIGPNFNISDFYVDGGSGGNVGRGGGGGSTVCCVAIPKQWRPGLTVEVRWGVGDWSKENRAEIDAGNYKSVTSEGIYKAKVPIEKYDEPGQLFVHFFAGGKVRVVVSDIYPEGKRHPIQSNDQHAADSATVGTRINELFTEAEVAEKIRQGKEYDKKHGDWR